MYKLLLISIGVLLFNGQIRAQDTTALRSTSFSDTTHITVVQHEPLFLLLNGRIVNGNLLIPPLDLRLQSYNTALFNPSSRLSATNHFSSLDNQMVGAQLAMQSLQLNLQTGLQPNKAVIAAGLMVNVFCLGGLAYQMLQPPKPDPNRPKAAQQPQR